MAIELLERLHGEKVGIIEQMLDTSCLACTLMATAEVTRDFLEDHTVADSIVQLAITMPKEHRCGAAEVRIRKWRTADGGAWIV